MSSATKSKSKAEANRTVDTSDDIRADAEAASAAGMAQRAKLQRNRRTFFITIGAFGQESTSRRGLTTDDVIREQTEDIASGRDYALAKGQSVEAFAAAEDDQVVWQGGKIVAIIRTDADGTPNVVRFDQSA